MFHDKRQYQRHDLDFFLHIEGENSEGQPFEEKTRLVNVSGGGAQFVTNSSHNYYEGQVLETSVVLPQTREVKGRMDTTATVVWLAQENHTDSIAEKQRLKVSICFKRNLELIRTDTSA